MSVTDRTAHRVLSVEDARRTLEGREFVVPASIANLGPGFDALAVAVQLYLRVRVTGIDPVARNAVRSRFGAVALEGDDYVARSIRTLAGREGVDYPALDLDIASDIPMQAGLGSSAAATVAGLRIYDALAGPAGRDLVAERSLARPVVHDVRVFAHRGDDLRDSIAEALADVVDDGAAALEHVMQQPGADHLVVVTAPAEEDRHLERMQDEGREIDISTLT